MFLKLNETFKEISNNRTKQQERKEEALAKFLHLFINIRSFDRMEITAQREGGDAVTRYLPL